MSDQLSVDFEATESCCSSDLQNWSNGSIIKTEVSDSVPFFYFITKCSNSSI